jgi:hypothetical protein
MEHTLDNESVKRECALRAVGGLLAATAYAQLRVSTIEWIDVGASP